MEPLVVRDTVVVASLATVPSFIVGPSLAVVRDTVATCPLAVAYP